MKKQTRCTAVHLTPEQDELLKTIGEKSGKSKSRILLDSAEAGLRGNPFLLEGKMLFLVTVRIDVTLVRELGGKLQSGELDTGSMLFTYCRKDDPSVGVSLWIVDNEEQFRESLEPFKKYYSDIMEIREVVPSIAAQRLLMSQ